MRDSRFEIVIDTENPDGAVLFFADVYNVENGLISTRIHRIGPYTYEYDAIEQAKEWIHETQRGVENE